MHNAVFNLLYYITLLNTGIISVFYMYGYFNYFTYCCYDG